MKTAIRVLVLTAVGMGLLAGCAKKTDPNPDSESPSTPTPAPAERPAASSAAAEGVWLTDFEAAKTQAAAESKDLLVDFSGSDWCYWCKRLNGEVFSRPAFVDQARKWFILVKIDFPSDLSRQPRSLQTQNKQLARQYRIEGYPTVILMRPDGTPYAQTGYREGGPDAYLTHLKELRQSQ